MELIRHEQLRRAPRRRSRIVFWRLVPIAALSYLRESPGPDGLPHAIFGRAVGGVRIADVLIVLYLLFLICTARGFSPARPSGRVLGAILLAGGAISASVLVGLANGYWNVFYDWRSVLLAALVAACTSGLVRTRGDVDLAIRAVVLVGGVFATALLVGFALGGGPTSQDLGHTPLSDGGSLWVLSFVALLGLACWLERSTSDWLVILSSLSALLLVLLAFRRTFWVVTAVGIAVTILIAGRGAHRIRLTAVAASIFLLVLLLAGPERVIGRFESFDPGANDQAYASTNADHLNDIREAWSVVKAHPLTGIGLGVGYESPLTRSWKAQSFGVHNALLHVWVFYGILGVVAYLTGNAVVLLELRRMRAAVLARAETSDSLVKPFVTSLIAWLIGTLFVGLFFSPWPYGSFQVMMFLGIAWGLGLRVSWLTRRGWPPVGAS